jgi:hypothetical protein
MQHLINKLVSIAVLIFLSASAVAQKQDSTIISVLVKDTVTNTYTLRSTTIAKDTVRRNAHRQMVKTYTTASCDSTLKMTMQLKVRMDSLRKMNVQTNLAMKMTRLKFDSLKRMNVLRDTVFNRSGNFKRLDSLRPFQVRLKLEDTMRTKVYLKQRDSVRMKIHLQQLKTKLIQLKMDSLRKQGWQTREVTMSLPVSKEGTVVIDNIGRKAIIKIVPGNMVKMITRIQIEDADRNLSDAACLDKMNLQMRTTKAGVMIDQKISNKNFGEQRNAFPATILLIPAGVKIVAESNYDDIQIDNDVAYLKVTVNNADLNMRNAGTAIIESKYAGIKAGTINNADLELMNTTFICKEIDQLKINSKNSKFSVVNLNDMVTTSFSDEYRIKEVNTMKGKKDFGKMDISSLKNTLVLTGSNSDLKLHKVDASASLVKLDNKFADVQITVNNLVDYSVNFEGNNSRLFTLSGKTATVFGVRKDLLADSLQKKSKTSYTTTVGNVSGSHTKFQINCNSCIVGLNN